jgi:hypothetical protein
VVQIFPCISVTHCIIMLMNHDEKYLATKVKFLSSL